MGIVDSRNMIMIALLTDDNDDDCLICWWWLGWGLDSSNHLNMIGILWTSLIKPWFLNERYEIRLLPPTHPLWNFFIKFMFCLNDGFPYITHPPCDKIVVFIIVFNCAVAYQYKRVFIRYSTIIKFLICWYIIPSVFYWECSSTWK